MTSERALDIFGVNDNVSLQVIALAARERAIGTRVWFLLRVRAQVSRHVLLPCGFVGAYVALMPVGHGFD